MSGHGNNLAEGLMTYICKHGVTQQFKQTSYPTDRSTDLSSLGAAVAFAFQGGLVVLRLAFKLIRFITMLVLIHVEGVLHVVEL